MTGGLVAAFDTSGPLGSVAVARDGEVEGRRFLLRRGEHGSHLVPALEGALQDAGAEPAHLDGLVVGSGPGSFTGIRVAAATARGLARSLDIPLHAFSSLAAAAAADGSELPGRAELPQALRAPEDLPPLTPLEGAPRLVLFDARGDRAYAATYQVREGRLHEAQAPAPVTVGELLDGGPPAATLCCGDGALRHRRALEEAGLQVAPPPLGVPTAEALLRLLKLVPHSAPVAKPGRWTPDYLRPVGARPPMDRSGGESRGNG